MTDLLENLSGHVDELLRYYQLGARNFKRVTLSQARFTKVALVKADFCNSNFAGAEFKDVDLSQAIFRRADLSLSKITSSNLSHADLREVNLENANIKEANLQDANLDRANLHQASLIDNNLQGVNLEQALLKGANLAYTNLQKANLTLANLTLANLAGADLSFANLHRTILKDAIYNETTRFPDGFDPNLAGMKITDLDATQSCEQLLERYRLGERNFRRITLTEACLGKVNLSGSDLIGADLTRADLSYANLQGAILVGAELGHATAEGADLTGVDLSRANLDLIQFKQGSLASANLDRSTFVGANLANTDLSGTSLEQASLMGANLSNVNLSNANLSNANLTEVNLTGANLRGANLSTATLNGTVLIGVLQNKNTCWPDDFQPVGTGVQSSDRSIKETDKWPSLSSSKLPAPTQQPTPTPSLGKTVSFSAEPVETDDFLQSSFTIKPALYLAFMLLSFATLGGGGYFIHTLLQQTSKLSDETELRISATDISAEESDAASMLIENIFGEQPADERFKHAAERYRNGQLDEAIVLLNSIPENSSDYNLAQDTVNVWQLESDRRYSTLARKELDSQNPLQSPSIAEKPLDLPTSLLNEPLLPEVEQLEYYLNSVATNSWLRGKIATALRSDEFPSKAESMSEVHSSSVSEPSRPQVDPETVPNGTKGLMNWPDGLAMRSEPGGAYIGGIPFNETVTILELSGDGRWQRVRRDRNGLEGWVKAGNIVTIQ